MSGLVRAQSDEQKPFASIPESVRARLIQRFAMFVFYPTAEEWDLLYELGEPWNVEGKRKDNYVTQRRRSGSKEKWFFGFIPERTEEASSAELPGAYKIIGYAKVQENGCLVKRKGFVHAVLRDGEWYFPEMILELPISHAPPAPCISER